MPKYVPPLLTCRMKRPVLFQEAGFWFVQDPVRFVPSTYITPEWERPLYYDVKQPEVKTLRSPPRLCGSWLSAYTISRFLIIRNWFRPNFNRAHDLAKELCGQGPIRPVVDNNNVITYEVQRRPRWEARTTVRGFGVNLGARRDNVGYIHAKYVRYPTRRKAQIARMLYWLEEKCQPIRRFFLELRRPLA